MPLWLKLLLGGVAAVTLLGVALCGLILLVSLWAMTSGPQHDTLGVIGERSVAVLHLGDATDDPGAQALLAQSLETFLVTAQKVEQGPQAPPPPPLGLDAMSWAWGLYLPREATLVLERDPASSSGLSGAGAINPRAFVRAVRSALELQLGPPDAPSDVLRRGDHLYLPTAANSSTYLSFAKGTLLWGELAPVERLHARLEAKARSQLADDVRALRSDWLVVGVTRELDGLRGPLRLQRAVNEAPEERSLDEVDFARAWIGLKVEDSDTVVLRMVVEEVSPGGLDLLAGAMQRRCETLTEELSDDDVVPECTLSQQGSELVLDARWTQLQASLARAFERDLRKSADEPSAVPSTATGSDRASP